MRRAVLDPNVFISALISAVGPPAKLVEEMQTGGLEVIVSPRLMAELEGVLARPKFRRYVDAEAVRIFLELLRHEARVAPDPDEPAPRRSVDPKDDYLLALAFSQSSHIVSGDSDLLDLSGFGVPVCAPVDLLDAVAA